MSYLKPAEGCRSSNIGPIISTRVRRPNTSASDRHHCRSNGFQNPLSALSSSPACMIWPPSLASGGRVLLHVERLRLLVTGVFPLALNNVVNLIVGGPTCSDQYGRRTPMGKAVFGFEYHEGPSELWSHQIQSLSTFTKRPGIFFLQVQNTLVGLSTRARIRVKILGCWNLP